MSNRQVTHQARPKAATILATAISQAAIAGASMLLALVIARHYGLAMLGQISPALAISQLAIGLWRVGYLEVGLVSHAPDEILKSRRHKSHGRALTLMTACACLVSIAAADTAMPALLASAVLVPGIGYESFRYRHLMARRTHIAALVDVLLLGLLLAALLAPDPIGWFSGAAIVKGAAAGLAQRWDGGAATPDQVSSTTSKRQAEGFLWGFGPSVLLATLALPFAGAEAAGQVRFALLLVGPIGILYSTAAIVALPNLSHRITEPRIRLLGLLSGAVLCPALIYVSVLAFTPATHLHALLGPEATHFVETHAVLIGSLILLKAAEIPGTLVARSKAGVRSFIIARRTHGAASFAAVPALVALAATQISSFLTGFLALTTAGSIGWYYVGATLDLRGTQEQVGETTSNSRRRITGSALQ